MSIPAPASKQWSTDDSSLRTGLRSNSSVNQQLWEGPVCEGDVTQTGILEWLDMRKGILFNEIKHTHTHTKTGWIFIIVEWLCTHNANTHFSSSKTTCKSPCRIL